MQRLMFEPVALTLVHSLVVFFAALLLATESASVSLVEAQPLKPRTATGISTTIHFFSIVYIPD
ncbi:hypothetical protein [Shewanella colwelliana]|uniref:hypothetical protein n=1 Tax=Shewanella colwelliana TaxID=23 RepID=UPI001586B87E|nr:hypothetical protein [Shewanella colwelliana]